MTRQMFMAQLRAGLAGLPPAVVDDLASDYEAHFAEAAKAGRGEADVAAALGDPGRLARELRAEAGLRRWETQRNPASALSAVFALLGLGALDVLFLAPILISIGGGLIGFFVAALALLGVGAILFAAGPFLVVGAPTGAVMLAGLGLVAGGLCLGSLSALAAIGCVNALVWYGRLHLNLLKPAMQSADQPVRNASGEIAA